MTASNALYQEVILDHNKKPRNYGTLPEATHRADGHNPLCGDQIHLTLKLADDTIEGVSFEGHSCAICKASASMMTTNVKGKSTQEAETLIHEFREMVTGKLDAEREPNHLGRLKIFSGISGLPSRVKCAVLPWHTLHAALTSQESVSTETDTDHTP